MKTERFNLRFYGQTQEKIEECVAKLKEADPNIIGHECLPLTQSINPFLPPGKHTEVRLTLTSRAAAEALHKNPITQRIYHQYANGTSLECEFATLRPGQKTFAQ